MAALLRLPAELRLKIYGWAISSSPNIINIDEGASSRDPPRSLAARSLAQVDAQLADEMLPIYWSTNIFEAYRLSGMGHYISTDRTFHRWLRDIVRDSVQHVRFLRFKGARVTLHEMQLHAPQCIMTVDVDIKRAAIDIWNKKSERCRCEHAADLQLRMERCLRHDSRIPNERPLQSLRNLWMLFECWYQFSPSRFSSSLRSWDEFERTVGALSGE